jgi:tetratricopeptide (TPR) repeat protein
LTEARARSDPASLFQRAIHLLQSGDPAAASLLPKLEHFPDFGVGWLALGEFLHKAGHHDAALMALGRAARAQPPSSMASHRLGQCLVETNARDAAIAAFTRAVGIDPEYAEAWYSLGLVQQDRGEHAAASQAYRAALQARPGFHEAALNLGVALQEDGRLDEAMDAYGVALRLREDSFGRIAQALVSGRTGVLWLDPAALRRHLVERGA